MGSLGSESLKTRSNSLSSMRDTFSCCFDIDFGNVRKPQDKTVVQLYNYKDIPSFLSGNTYILGGYRAFLPLSLCMKSLFVWSNESINIWSHLLGFILFLFLMVYDLTVSVQSYNTYLSDYLVILFGLICFQYCMLCSTGYHIFCCHSEKSCSWWLGVDMGGISIGVIGCYIPSLYYGYYCISIWRDVYILTISILTAGTLLLQRQPEFKSKRWFNLRIIIYSSLCASGIIPTIHWVILNGGFGVEIVQEFFPKIVILYMLLLIAVLFYLTKIPERLFPGKFDFIGSSHQCWHFTIVVAFIWAYSSGKELFIYRVTNPCVL